MTETKLPAPADRQVATPYPAVNAYRAALSRVYVLAPQVARESESLERRTARMAGSTSAFARRILRDQHSQYLDLSIELTRLDQSLAELRKRAEQESPTAAERAWLSIHAYDATIKAEQAAQKSLP